MARWNSQHETVVKKTSKSGKKIHTVPQNLIKIAHITSKKKSNNDALSFDVWNLSKS